MWNHPISFLEIELRAYVHLLYPEHSIVVRFCSEFLPWLS